LYRIKRLKYKFYRNALKDKAKAKSVKLEMDFLKEKIKTEKYSNHWLYYY